MGSDNLFWLKKRKKLTRKSKLIREYKNSILIICEGEKTEPNYLKSFPVSGVQVEVIGKGKNTLSLVKDAIYEWKKNAKEGKFYEKLWCVFDRDDFPQQDYNQAFETIIDEERNLNKKFKKKAGREISIRIAYSNEAFELWYLLHFDYHTTGYNRIQYKSMLSKRLLRKYKKNDPGIYYDLEKLFHSSDGHKGQKFAIKNARKIRDLMNNDFPHNHNPSTSVDLLVEELN